MTQTANKKFPTIADLKKGKDINTDKFSLLMNNEPPKEWLEKHKDIPNYVYIPIEKVEYLLKNVLFDYREEILREGEGENGVYICLRLHYKIYKNSQWSFNDGIGATALEKKNGKIVENALNPAYPKAKKLALSNASKKFGRLFGSELNRTLSIAEKKDNIRKKTNYPNLP